MKSKPFYSLKVVPGDSSGLTNAQFCTLYQSDQKKKTEALRKKLWRAKLKENPQEYERYKINERYRKLKKSNKANNTTDPAADIVIEIVEERPSSSNVGRNSSPSSFSNKQSLHRSLSRVDNYLPKSPHKKAEVIEKLAERYEVKFLFKKKRPW